MLSPHQQQSVGHGEKMPNVFDRRSPPTELMTSPTDRFDVVSHVEGALPSPLLSPAPMMMERLAAMTIWISRPATWYSTCSAPVFQDPHTVNIVGGDISLFPPSLARLAIRCFLPPARATRRHVITRQSLNGQRIDATSGLKA